PLRWGARVPGVRMSVKRCGFQHHLVVECRFHLATFVGQWLVSTVGDHRDKDGSQKTIGAGMDSLYETYVFRTDGIDDPETGHPSIWDWSELWGERHASDI